MLHHLPRRRAFAALPLALVGLTLAPAAVAGPGTPATCAIPATSQLPACLPNLSLAMQGPASLSGGELVTWTITLTHQGYPGLADDIEPDAPVRVSAIRVDVPEWSRFDLEPESVPADGLLRRGQSLTYRWSGRFGTEICRDKTSETVRAVVTVSGVRETTTVDNTAVATSRVVPCLTDLGVTKRADRAA